MCNINEMLSVLIDINVDKYIVNDYILYSRHISFINVIRYTSLISIIHILIDIIKCWTFKVVTDENKFKFLKAYNLVSDKKYLILDLVKIFFF
ncbi:hypothetical protein L0P85_11340 [Terrisporobacter glycolicus]|nr:hypothetical protein L0P85_11340 [Terrisporobacter glycolicus]